MRGWIHLLGTLSHHHHLQMCLQIWTLKRSSTSESVTALGAPLWGPFTAFFPLNSAQVQNQADKVLWRAVTLWFALCTVRQFCCFHGLGAPIHGYHMTAGISTVSNKCSISSTEATFWACKTLHATQFSFIRYVTKYLLWQHLKLSMSFTSASAVCTYFL